MKRILIVKPSSMGDVLHAFPAVNALLQQEEELTVDWVIHPAFEELLDYLPLNGRRILFRRKELSGWKTFLPELRSLIRDLRKERYDAVLDLQGLFRSALLGVLCKSPIRSGPAQPKEKIALLCYNQVLRWGQNTLHALEKNCDMARDFLNGKIVSTQYTLPGVERFQRSVDRLFEQHSLPADVEFFAIAPGTRWVTKQWGEENFAKSALAAAKELPGKHFILLGSPGEKALCAKIASILSGKVSCTDLCGKTSMGELVEVIRRAEVLLCNDSGPMHAAAAAGTPCAAFFAPTDPLLTGPYSEKSVVLRPADLKCLNCFRKQCQDPQCHKALSPEEMTRKVLELWQKERKRS